MGHLRILATAALVLLFAAACGGTAATTKPAAATVSATGPAATSVATAPAGLPSTAATVVPAAGSPATGDICSLLTPGEISTATGKVYLAGTPDISGQCEWNTNMSGANSGDLIIAALQAQDLALMKSMFGTGGEDVTVAGHPAFYNPGEGVNSLWVDVGGGNLLVLSFPRSGDLDPSYKAIALALATTAVARV